MKLKLAATIFALFVLLSCLCGCVDNRNDCESEIRDLEYRIIELEEYKRLYSEAKEQWNHFEYAYLETICELEEAEHRVYSLEESLRWYEDNCFCSVMRWCDICDWPCPEDTLKYFDGDYYCAQCLWDELVG